MDIWEGELLLSASKRSQQTVPPIRTGSDSQTASDPHTETTQPQPDGEGTAAAQLGSYREGRKEPEMPEIPEPTLLTSDRRLQYRRQNDSLTGNDVTNEQNKTLLTKSASVRSKMPGRRGQKGARECAGLASGAPPPPSATRPERGALWGRQEDRPRARASHQ
ncbi:hypothetical protein P7K49_012381 [Saguinus oedipus]|uniref:Uncharacterized protein n=1 Tax=Saguinus oedipus TaxID=9490 RepID=A0ABQ9VTB5_SAGOE|nr:hypothetical protein P7K49_012381 [Saguinus oedipus]